mgnify:FL=1
MKVSWERNLVPFEPSEDHSKVCYGVEAEVVCDFLVGLHCYRAGGHLVLERSLGKGLGQTNMLGYKINTHIDQRRLLLQIKISRVDMYEAS